MKKPIPARSNILPYNREDVPAWAAWQLAAELLVKSSDQTRMGVYRRVLAFAMSRSHKADDSFPPSKEQADITQKVCAVFSVELKRLSQIRGASHTSRQDAEDAFQFLAKGARERITAWQPSIDRSKKF